jgi:hypothetical protein
MYGSYVKSLSKFLAFLGENWTLDTALQKLEDVLRDSVAVEEPSVVKFMIFSYAFDQLNKPDDFQVRQNSWFACCHFLRLTASAACGHALTPRVSVCGTQNGGERQNFNICV